MNYIFNKEQYLAAKAAWKSMTNRNAVDHIIYNAIRGFDIKRGFTGITNPTKLGNGAEEWAGFKFAKEQARYRFKTKMIWPNDQERQDRIFASRCKELSDRYGIEFNEELMEKMREVLK